jgi:hypothetical protein
VVADPTRLLAGVAPFGPPVGLHLLDSGGAQPRRVGGPAMPSIPYIG